MTGNGHDNGHLPRRPGRQRRTRPALPTPAPALPLPAPPPQALTTLDPSPQRRFRDLQEQLRLGIWDYAEGIGYNPWQAMIAMALSDNTPAALQVECHKEVAQYLLPKLASIKVQGEVEHHHTSEPLQVLFAKLEQEEEAERASLPPWTPPGLEALEMRRSGEDAWDLEGSEESEDED
jgi:hypothetical protein